MMADEVHERGEAGLAGRLLLPLTVGGTGVLMLLGIYTAAVGAGLACDARWPLCDGAVFGLFPANWPSFIEWFHRLVAMITGGLIIASAWLVWRRADSRRGLYAFSGAVALLPVQIWLGAETVLSYEILTLTAHFLVALIIFACVLLGSVWALGWPRRPAPWPQRLLVIALAGFVPFVLLTPHGLVVHTGRVQVIYYALGLLVFASFLLVMALTPRALGDRPGSRILTAVGGAGTMLVALQLLAGRLVRTSAVHAIDTTAALATVAILVGGLWLSSQHVRSRSVSGAN